MIPWGLTCDAISPGLFLPVTKTSDDAMIMVGENWSFLDPFHFCLLLVLILGEGETSFVLVAALLGLRSL